jgi:hypothetical protein
LIPETHTALNLLPDTVMIVTALHFLHTMRPAALQVIPIVLPAVGSPSDMMPLRPSLRVSQTPGGLYRRPIIEATDRGATVASGLMIKAAVNNIRAMVVSGVDLGTVEEVGLEWHQIASS